MSQRAKLLHLLHILQERTDEEHGMTAEEIQRELLDMGVSAERKAIYQDVKALCDAGFDVIFSRKKENYGFYLNSHTFEPAELRILMDALQSASFLPEGKTKELIQKLLGLVSIHQARDLSGQLHALNPGKTTNGQALYTIDAIQRAISKGKKITFTYHRTIVRSNRPAMARGRKFEISPYALLWENDRYYLIGNYRKYDNLSHYRLDRIKSVKLLDEKARSFEEVSPYKGIFNTSDYVRHNFNMFGGKEDTVHLLCGHRGLEILLDKFGKDMKIFKFGGDEEGENYRVIVDVNVSDGFIEWLIQFGDTIEVLAPSGLRDDVKKKIIKIAAVYHIEIK